MFVILQIVGATSRKWLNTFEYKKEIAKNILLLHKTALVIILLKRITLQSHYRAVIKSTEKRNYYSQLWTELHKRTTGARNNLLYIPNCAKVISRFIPLGSGMISRLWRQTRNLSWALNRPQTKRVANSHHAIIHLWSPMVMRWGYCSAY